jgi:hypothetical protein
MDGWRAGKHREMTRDADGIRQAPPVQRAPEGGDVAELGVREHGRDLQSGGARAPDQRQRLTPFLVEGRAGRNLCHRTPIGVAEPGFREIQQRTGHPRAAAGPERSRRRDLAIGDLAQRATVLTRHADRMGALFGKTGAVDDQHAATLGQHLQETPPDPIGVPGRVRNEMLKALVADRVRDAGQHRLHRLALAVAEDAVHVRPQREPLGAMAEAPLKRFEPANQALHARGRRAIDHREPAYRIHAMSTRSSPRFTKTFRNKAPDLTKSY